MEIGDRVTLATFNGKRTAPANVPSNENYWKLIGSHGKLIEGKDEQAHATVTGRWARVWVKFDCDVRSFGLEAHNRVRSSLWIRRSDLRLFKARPTKS